METTSVVRIVAIALIVVFLGIIILRRKKKSV
ncbi:MAG: LPXTG cell wall anchor domain-containing protein [Acidobacteriaceae bacterium]|jgi:LPXTG-motif cell wall-anchored protein